MQGFLKKLYMTGDFWGGLAAMLVGQSLGLAEQPVYGCYVIGQNWCFMTLINKTYCISPGYSALTDEIAFIFRTLKGLKEIVKCLTKEA